MRKCSTFHCIFPPLGIFFALFTAFNDLDHQKSNQTNGKQSKWWAKEFCILSIKNRKYVLCNVLNTHRTTCLWRSTQYLIALRTMISCFLLKPFGLAKFGGTLKVPPHSAFGTNTLPLFSSSRSSSVSTKKQKRNQNEKAFKQCGIIVCWISREFYCAYRHYWPIRLLN